MRRNEDLDRQIRDYKQKFATDMERKLRGMNFAKLQLLNKDYKGALRSINDFLSAKPESAAGYKVLGQVYEALDENLKAIDAYKRSFQLDKKQLELLLTICRLYNFTPGDAESMRQWLLKAEKVYPYHEEVLKLRQMTAENQEDPLSATLKDISNLSIHNMDTSVNTSINGTPVVGGATAAAPVSAYQTPIKLDNQLKSIARTQEQIIRKLVETQETINANNERLLETIGQSNEKIQSLESQLKQLSDNVSQLQLTQVELKQNLEELYGNNDDQDYDEEEYDDEEDNNDEDRQEEVDENRESNLPNQTFNFGAQGNNNNTNSVFSRLGGFGNQQSSSSNLVANQSQQQQQQPQHQNVQPQQQKPKQQPKQQNLQQQMPVQQPTQQRPQPPSNGFGNQFAPPANSWECSACYVNNPGARSTCVSCETPNPANPKPAAASNAAPETRSLLQQPSAAFTFGVPNQSVGGSSGSTTFPPPKSGFFFANAVPSASAPVQPTPSVISSQPAAATVSTQSVSTTQPPFSFSSQPANTGFTFGNLTSAASSTSPFSFQNLSATATTPSSIPFSMSSSPSTTFAPDSSQPELTSLQQLQKHVERQTPSVVQTSATFVPPVSTQQSPSAPMQPFGGFGIFGQSTSPLNLSFLPSSTTSSQPLIQPNVTNLEPVSQPPAAGLFSFGSSSTFDFKFNLPSSTTSSSAVAGSASKVSIEDISKIEKKKTDGGGGESDGEVAPNNADEIHFQPVIPLPPRVEVRTGEEDEEVLFVHRARLFRFDNGEWKERGTGDIKVLLDVQNRRYRFLMRREQIHKVCLNHQIGADFAFFDNSLETRSLKELQWAATDFSDGEACPLVFTIRFKNSDIRNRFMDLVISIVGKIQNGDVAIDSLNDTQEQSFNETGVSHDQVDDKVDDVQVVFIRQPSEELRLKAKQLMLPENFYNYEQVPACSGCLGCEERIPTLRYEVEGFDVRTAIRQPDSDQSFVSSFPSVASGDNQQLQQPQQPPPTSQPMPSQPVFGTLFSGFTSGIGSGFSAAAGGNLFSAAIAETGAKTGGWAQGSTGQSKWASNKVQPLFSNLGHEGGGHHADNATDNPEAEANVDFQPVIPLPDLIEVRTGEEEETVLFSYRAKCYRFTHNEWKERGTGEFRLLKNKNTGKVRLLMRRDQIHKVCLNHNLEKDLDIKLRENSDTIFQWNAIDFTDPSGTPEVLALRFKNADVAKTFASAIDQAKKDL